MVDLASDDDSEIEELIDLEENAAEDDLDQDLDLDDPDLIDPDLDDPDLIDEEEKGPTEEMAWIPEEESSPQIAERNFETEKVRLIFITVCV